MLRQIAQGWSRLEALGLKPDAKRFGQGDNREYKWYARALYPRVESLSTRGLRVFVALGEARTGSRGGTHTRCSLGKCGSAPVLAPVAACCL